ncbi:hypothetical protein TRFO_37561 [Tritrichomonas foetus]|uniref:Secretory carrier membrane protein n=1 Tax=Tritrichomonas foetus TaxID=1144522 RepID=A0A1J4JAV6_9EUKA|nr:hypothetical protein TRFO_37561 [Tritrichomonas foetus]|eukprot:OHS96288.1 hypothetical protein TRFO_37561 [Tritrichomonas foetus]
MDDPLSNYNPFQSEPISLDDPPSSFNMPPETTTQQTNSNPQNYSIGFSNSNNSQSDQFKPPITNSAVFVDPVIGMVPISESDLAAREAELSRREAEIAKHESIVSHGGSSIDDDHQNKVKNFPPYIKIWKYYQESDLPNDIQPLVKQVLYLFLLCAITYLANWIGCLCCIAAGDSLSSVGTIIVLSTVYLFTFVPMSFEFSFFVLYNAVKDGKGLKFFCFLTTFGIWGLTMSWHMVGTDDGGSVGWIQMINLFAGGHGFIGFVALLVSLCFTVCVAGIAFYWLKCYRYYQTNGLSRSAFGEASAYATNYATENPDVMTEVLNGQNSQI